MDGINLTKYRVKILSEELFAGFEALSQKHDNRVLAEKLGFNGKGKYCHSVIPNIKKNKTIVASRFPLFLRCLDEARLPHHQPSKITRKEIEVYGRGIYSYTPVDPETFGLIVKTWCELYDNKS